MVYFQFAVNKWETCTAMSGCTWRNCWSSSSPNITPLFPNNSNMNGKSLAQFNSRPKYPMSRMSRILESVGTGISAGVNSQNCFRKRIAA